MCGDPPVPSEARIAADRRACALARGRDDRSGCDGTLLRLDPGHRRRAAGQPAGVLGRRERAPPDRARVPQPIPVRDPAGDERGVARRRRLGHGRGAEPDPAVRRRRAQLRLAVLRGHRPPARLRRREPDHLREPLRGRADRRPGPRTSPTGTTRRSSPASRARRAARRSPASRSAAPARTRPPTTARSSSPTTRAGASGRCRGAPTAFRIRPPGSHSSPTRPGPVDLQVGPGGDLFYADFDGGTIRRITYGGPAAEDKALGRPATASSVEKAGLEPHLGNDGNSSTRWSSSFADDQWWQVDLGSPRNVDRVTINWEIAHASRYQILTSTNGTSFTLAAEQTLTTPSPPNHHLHHPQRPLPPHPLHHPRHQLRLQLLGRPRPRPQRHRRPSTPRRRRRRSPRPRTARPSAAPITATATGDRQRCRRRRPVQARRGQPRPRGHDAAVHVGLEHDHRGERRPHADCDGARLERKHGHVEPRRRHRRERRPRGQGARAAGDRVQRRESRPRAPPRQRRQLQHPLELQLRRRPMVASRPRQPPQRRPRHHQLGDRPRLPLPDPHLHQRHQLHPRRRTNPHHPQPSKPPPSPPAAPATSASTAPPAPPTTAAASGTPTSTAPATQRRPRTRRRWRRSSRRRPH